MAKSDPVTVARDAARRCFAESGVNADEAMATPEFRVLLQREMSWQFAWCKHNRVPVALTQGFMMVAGDAAATFYQKQELKNA